MIYAYAALAILAAFLIDRFPSLRVKRIVIVGLALPLLFVPLLDSSEATRNLLADAAIYVALALGLNIVVGFAGLLDLGYAAFFAIGAYAYGMLASPQFGLHLPFWVILLLAGPLAAFFGMLLGAPTLRLRGDYLAIVTLGFGEIVPQIFQNLTAYTGGPNGIPGLDVPSLFGVSFGASALPFYYLALALVALAIFIAGNLRASRLGRAWMAIRDDELAAKHAGIDTTRAKLAAFAIGASFSGCAGVLFAAKLGLVSPDLFGFQVSVLIVSMLVLGGMGNLSGVVVGSLVLSMLNSAILPQANMLAANVLHVHVDLSQYHFAIYGVILVAMMLWRPSGLIARRAR
ncbi:MAG: branched-chain amino acid ABC transporter permease [Vulcanimicrobiaceae bacterium]